MNFSIADGVNYVSKFTVRRIFNAVKVVFSFYLSKYSKKPIQWGLPISISVEPTTSCNLRCPECPSGKREFTRPTGMLNESFFKKTINELYRDIFYLTFYFQGEPYLNPAFLEMVNYASSKKIYTSTSTNAHFLTDENARKTVVSGLDRLIISIDGTTQQTYEQYRIGGDLKKVIEGAENIIKWKEKLHSKTPHVIFQFLVVRPNEHQINDVEVLAKKLKVNEVRFKTAQIYDYEQGNKLIPSIGKYSRYQQKNDGTYSIKNNMLNHCWKLWHSTVITWDGLVVPCCFDKDATHQLGDLKMKTFKQVWESNEYNMFRGNLLKSRSEIDICKNCTEGTKVWA
jgi:radical SAM protein with 4Fe4S-binding SPASM domain